MTVKICFYNHTGLISGAEKALFNLIVGLDNKYEPSMVAPLSEGMRAFCHKHSLALSGVNELRARFCFNPIRLVAYLFSIVRVMGQVRAAIKRCSPDVIHANSTRAGIVAFVATIGLRLPVIWHIHDILPLHPFSTAIRHLALGSRRSILLGCSRAVALSVLGHYTDDFPYKRKIYVAHNGIKESDQSPSQEERSAVRNLLGLGDDQFVIAIVGQIAPRKDHAGLVRAFARFSKIRQHSKLLVIGKAIFNRDDKYLASVRNLCEVLGLQDRVLFLGERDDVPRIMRSIDLLILNSKVEPFGLVILEAMLNGTPVLATKSGGPAEIISHGVNGHLVCPADEDALVSALIELSSQPTLMRQYSDLGPPLVRSRFTLDKYIVAVTSVYDHVLAANPVNIPSRVRPSGEHDIRSQF